MGIAPDQQLFFENPRKAGVGDQPDQSDNHIDTDTDPAIEEGQRDSSYVGDERKPALAVIADCLGKGGILSVQAMQGNHQDAVSGRAHCQVKTVDRHGNRSEMVLAHERFPCLATAGIRKWVNGAFTFTPDGNPIVGPVRGLKNYWVACGVMVRANLDDPAGYIKQILPLGFESIQPFFWQTLGGKDLPRLAGQIREAIGDADVIVSSLGVFGNPLEDGEVDRGVLAAWETVIDNAHLFGTSMVSGFTGRLRGKKLTDSLPRFREVWGPLAKRAADKGVRIAFENCAMYWAVLVS